MQAKHKAHIEQRVTMLGTLPSASLQGLETYLSILVAMVTVKVPSVSGR